ncbi:MAG: MFS transporter, partial [Oscillospiraceae bacterium]|nr:MFS transporter [Oscillospiraceae bacterium]
LLFLTLQRQYGIPIGQITVLITVNFAVQLTVDLLSAFWIDRIGYRRAVIAAHVFSAAGLLALPVLPEFLPPFPGILCAVILYAVGGGLLEVLVSPIMESCPTENKETAMSLLHSFYCWGQAGVVLLSALFFRFAGIGNWKLLAVLWAILPVCNGFCFRSVPIAPLVAPDEERIRPRTLLKSRMFLLLMLMMVCAGAAELSVSQWASFLAEQALHISKTAGDLAGPMMFGVLMGAARTFYGRYGEKIPLERFMTGSAVLCIVSYLMIALSPVPAVSLAGCALCGLSVGIMWPGTFSMASASLRRGGTLMFSLLALGGDAGCGGGPTLVGTVAGTGSIKTGILAAAVFPAGLILCIDLVKRERSRS